MRIVGGDGRGCQPPEGSLAREANAVKWIMRYPLLAGVVLAGLAAALPVAASQDTPSTQTAPSPGSKTKPDKPDPNKPVTMSGCVVRDSAGKDFTFTDNANGFQYHLSGQDVSKFAGQPLEIIGIVDTKRLRVKTGLYPSPNVAAQAGAIDPGKAHVAALGGGTTGSGNVELPTFKVAQVRAAQGECRK